ncbi:MAG: large subunit ribosomal protein L25, partial [Parcubacteria group bacterium Greene0416_79]
MPRYTDANLAKWVRMPRMKICRFALLFVDSHRAGLLFSAPFVYCFAMVLTLHYERRDVARQKPNALRRAGKLPAVLYGRKQKATPIVLSFAEFDKVWRKAGESAVLTLKGSAGGEIEALIHEIDRDPVKDTVRHADFTVYQA